MVCSRKYTNFLINLSAIFSHFTEVNPNAESVRNVGTLFTEIERENDILWINVKHCDFL